jgi:hypothetical protein
MQVLVAALELQRPGIAVAKLPRPSKLRPELVHASCSLLSGVAYWQGLFGQVQVPDCLRASHPGLPYGCMYRVCGAYILRPITNSHGTDGISRYLCMVRLGVDAIERSIGSAQQQQQHPYSARHQPDFVARAARQQNFRYRHHGNLQRSVAC